MVAKTFLEIKKGIDIEKSILQIEKYNPYHGKDGRFTGPGGFASGGFVSGGGGKYVPDKKTTAKLSADAVKKATDAEKQMTADISKYAGAAGGTMEGLKYAVKGEDSLNRKLISEQLEREVTPAKALARMYDINRYTMTHDADHLTESAKSVMSNLEKDGYKVMRVKNTMADTNAPYRGINTVIQSPNGTKFELQFHTKQSLEIKEINHKLYEEQRLDTTSSKRKAELDKQMTENLKNLQIPKGIEKIESFNNL